MKKSMNWALMLVAILTTGLTFTSCDEDHWNAQKLDGQWSGDFGMYYTDHYGYEWDADYTIIDFYQSALSDHGTGRQYDYYSKGPYEYQFFRFEWSVRNGIVHFHYPSDPNLDVDIYDYDLGWNYFEGFLGSSRTSFRLIKYTDDFDWDEYNGDYCYYYDYGYSYGGYNYDDYYNSYYAKTRSAGNDSIGTIVPLVKNGNRFNEKK